MSELTQTTITEQRSAFAAALALAETFPELPAPFAHVHSTGPVLKLQFSTPADFEEWRAVLGIAPEGVVLHASATNSWLDAHGVYADVPVHLTGFGIQLADEQAEALVSA